MYQDNAKAYHSINFGDKNTWDDWHMVPSSRPTFSMPTVKQNILEVPGMSGAIDMSRSLTGFPLYSNRTGSFEFIVLNDYFNWVDLYSYIANYLHGKEMDCYLEDDPDYIYHGTFVMREYKPGRNNSTVSIEYSVDPYKINRRTSVELFPTIFKNLSVDTNEKEFTFNARYMDSMPVKPTINVVSTDPDANFIFTFKHPRTGNLITKTVPCSDEIIFNEFMFVGMTTTVKMKLSSGTAKVSFVFNPGRL